MDELAGGSVWGSGSGVVTFFKIVPYSLIPLLFV